MSDEDIVELRRMRDRGEITDAQYDVLRRHVLWGTPLPEAIEALSEELAEEEPAPSGRHAHPAPAEPRPAPRPEPLPHLGHPTGAQPAATPYTGHPTGGYPPIPPHLVHPADRDAEERAPRRPVPPVPGKAERRRRRKGRAAFLVPLLLAVGLVGAGVWWFTLRPTGVAPEAFARSVCSDVQSWHDDVTARSGALQQALNSNTDPEATRAALADFFDQAAARTSQLRTDIDGLGTPSVDSGQSYVSTLDTKLSGTAASFRDSAQRSRALDVNDRAAFAITVQVLQSQVDQLISGVTGALADPATPGELRTAYNNASGCAPFTG